jgi:hypothetical protein
MIAELIALNASYKVLKTAFSNGKELLDIGTGVHDYFSAEQEVRKKLEAGEGDVVTRFKAKKALQRAEEELKFELNKESLLGYHEFLQFKADYYNEKKEAKLAEARRIATRNRNIKKGVSTFFKVLACVIVASASLFGVAIYIKGYY